MGDQEDNHTHLLTEEECKDILEKMLRSQNETGSLVAYEITRNQNAVGNLGEYFDLNLKYHKDNGDKNKKLLVEKRLFIKTVPYRNPEVCQYIRKSKIIRKESRLYMHLLNELRKCSPNIWCAECYFYKTDLLVIQNVKDLGYEHIEDVTRFFTKPEIEAVLKSLATMHASGYAFGANRRIIVRQYMRCSLFEVHFSNKVAWYTGSVKAILAVLKRDSYYHTEILQHFIEYTLPKLLDKALGMAGVSHKYLNVFSHRDIWGGNVLFSKNDPSKRAIFVDYQFARFAPPAIDVLTALFLNLKPSERKPLEEEYGKFYYQHFAEEMRNMELTVNTFLTYPQFKKCLEDMGLFGALYNCISATYLKSPLKDMSLNLPEDFEKLADVDRTQEVIELMNSNAGYKNHLIECLHDLMDLAMRRKFGDK